MSEHRPPREVKARRAWPWLVLAVCASLVPAGFVNLTWNGLPTYLPVFSVVAMVDGLAARRFWFWAPDLMVAGWLPLLVLVAALPIGPRRWAEPVVAVALGVMAAVDLVVAVDMLPPALITPAEISAGSQPDFTYEGPVTFVPFLVGAVAYAVAAVALVLGSRWPGRRAGGPGASRMPRSS
ncbi:hypothetical protein ACQPZZ_36115 [Microbispora sp. CA-135349]|uniref:hypothetical protein n=1 Tax=Microbispora sp. CA-135349 TaxID=3239953 RepID=UPI003D8EA00C